MSLSPERRGDPATRRASITASAIACTTGSATACITASALSALLIFLASLLPFAAPGVAQAADDFLSPLIGEITFEGNRALSDGDLRNAMRLRQPTPLRPLSKPRFPGADFLAGDLNEILLRYREAGYPLAEVVEAIVSYDESGEKVDIHVQIDEGPLVRLRNLRVVAPPPGDERKLRNDVDLSRGDVLAHAKLEAGGLAIQQFYEEKGYALSRVLREVRIDADSADVVFRVAPGPEVRIDSVVVEPMEMTKRETVVRELTLAEGDLLTPKGLLESRRRLLDSGVFRSVRVSPEFVDSTTALAWLKVTAREKKRYWVGGGAGYSSADQLRILSEWGVRNLQGEGRRVSGTGDLYYSIDPGFRGGGVNFQEGLVRLDYFEPRFLRTRNRASIGTYLRWIQEETFHERIFGYTVSLLREISLTTRASISLETREVATTEDGVRPRYSTRFLRLGAFQDDRDNPFDPSEGRYLQGQVEYAGGLLGGTNEFLRTVGSWRGYTSTDAGVVFAARVRGGFIEPLSSGVDSVDSLEVARIPWEERFRVGGSNTIRGYGENEVGRRNADGESTGGLLLFLANLEVRFPIFWIVRGGLFLDAGNVWADPKEFKISRFTAGLENKDYDPLGVFYGVGGGLRFVTPVGPLRFDYGFQVGSGHSPDEPRGQLHVALGQAF
ncbi:MAG: BamA/TamA family outer membrane protein [Candidatus Eisenbacteria bacterium]|nr:BamA/TamA family outer membrane protein [Candidatus Eisenbacteria bacterium]